MNWQRLIFFFCAMAVLSFSTNGLAKSNDLSIKPTIPSSKVKITAPSPAPPVLVAPTKTKTPTHKPAVSAGTPKPAAPKVSVKQPKPSSPKVSVKQPKPSSHKVSVGKPNFSSIKPLTSPASLPPSIGRSGLPSAHIPRDLGKAVHMPGSVGRNMGQTNSISGRMPAGHISPAAGFGSTGGAAGLAKGVGQRDGVGSVKDEFSDLMGPTLRTGSGAQRQGQDKGETWGLALGNYSYSNVPEKDAEAMITAAGEAKGKSDEEQEEIYTTLAILYGEYLDPSDTDSDSGGGTAGDDDEEDPNPWNAGTVFGDDDDSDDPPLDLFGEVEERTADSGPGDDNSGGPINPNKIKNIFAGSPGIRFAPGEEPSEGGVVDLSLLGEIQGGQTQVHTFEGGVPESSNFEDRSKQVQDAIKSGGQGNPIVE